MAKHTDLELTNIPTMDVGEMVSELSAAYCSLIRSGQPLRLMPSVMLWGPPGVGKSQGIRQIAKEVERQTGKKTSVTDVRLLLFNPIDLRGIPVANADKTLAVWLKPRIFQMDESDDTVNFLFLDELTAAPQSVQAAAYQITLDRVIGEHRLPDNCIVLAAGNRTTDKSVAFKMPKALANRLLHIEIGISNPAWQEWAARSGVNGKVLGYLSRKKDALMAFDAASEDLAFATPRSWEMVSDLLNAVSSDVDAVFPLIAGLIGVGAASEFRTWCRVCGDLPDVGAIFEGKDVEPPASPDELYALISAMTSYASENRDDMTAIANSIRFARKLPPDFAVVLLRNYISIEKGYREKLMRLPEFAKWAQTLGGVLNAVC